MTVKLGTPAERMIVAPDSRSQLVAALATVPGLTATPQVPDVPTEGAAWPVWIQTTFDGSLGLPGAAGYDVYALLPAGYIGTTVETADGLLGQLVAALWQLAIVQLAEPVQVRFDNQTTMPGMRLRVRMRGSSNDSDSR